MNNSIDTNISENSYVESDFLYDIIHGLSQSPKTLPCKYFYDERGSQLFEQICTTDEYYITRTELALLKQIMPELAELMGAGCDILEFGSGAGIKIQTLLRGLTEPRSYIPVDISEEILQSSAKKLEIVFPKIEVHPIVGDYTKEIVLPELFGQETPHKKMVFFPGSTISNFDESSAFTFLTKIHSLLNSGDVLFIGVDLVKPIEILHAAYNDEQGVTAEFNMNLLHRINQSFADSIDLNKFAHHAFFNEERSRIEMHLVSTEKQKIEIAGNHFSFEEGEGIHTENSYKYSVESFQNLAQKCGFQSKKAWVDEDQLFSLHYLEV
jgi:dimethylhistidine N-methyltransferase